MASLAGCGEPDPGTAAVHAPHGFVDVTASSGLDFRHEATLSGRFLLQEIMGSGLAVFDADGDGDLDLYLIDAGESPERGRPNRLFLQISPWRFEEVEDALGLNDAGYGMGVAVGDLEGDGDLDVYVANRGRDRLYLGEGPGRYRLAWESPEDSWTSAAAFLDFDGDGLLDVYAARYVAADPKKRCSAPDGSDDYCSPKVYRGLEDRLWRGRPGGALEDVTAAAGIAGTRLSGLGVLVHDVDDDGRPDIFVANDGQPNLLWRNLGGRFENRAWALGTAVNGQGQEEASMGIAAGDPDGDGDLDLFVTHLDGESDTLYLRSADGFEDGTTRAGLHAASLRRTAFGAAFLDVDHDGDEDLAVATGRVQKGPARPGPDLDALWARYADVDALHLNDGQGRFVLAGGEAGDLGGSPAVSRALAAVDLDGDGDLDLVETRCRGRARLLENRFVKRGSYLLVDAVEPSGRRPPGARVRVRAAGRVHVRETGSTTSYQTAVDAPLHFGLGAIEEIDAVEIRWPGGLEERFAGGAANRRLRLVRGEGEKMR